MRVKTKYIEVSWITTFVSFWKYEQADIYNIIIFLAELKPNFLGSNVTQ